MVIQKIEENENVDLFKIKSDGFCENLKTEAGKKQTNNFFGLRYWIPQG